MIGADFSNCLEQTSRPTKPMSRVDLMTLVARAKPDPCGHGPFLSTGRLFTKASASVTRRTRFKPTSFNLHLLPHYPRKLDRVYDGFVEAVDPGYRIDR